MDNFICSSCNGEKVGEKVEWYEIFNRMDRGVKLKEGFIYICKNCGAHICKDCKEHKIKVNIWSGWEKAKCPCCSDTFAPDVQSEINRGIKIRENQTLPKNENKEVINNIIGDSHKVEMSPNQATKNSNNEQIIIPDSVSVLKFFAWLDLIVSIILAIYLWNEHYNVMMGIGVILQGIFVCALFLVVALIAENLIVINHNTTKIKNKLK
ncbi:MAG: hypothetical protein CVV24_09590 [Ignavibacteriae bacterium HGW-Ignavibacteriae-3]|nr:MAG: hypothetical protein CVV24_09590 [Ignavibacteriae bacterium HGW-Ignavibacteriae-3]